MRIDPFRSVIGHRKLRDGARTSLPPKPAAKKIDHLVKPSSGGAVVPLAAPPQVFTPLAQLPPVEADELDRLPEPQGVLQGWWNQTLDAFQGRHATRELARARKVVETVRELEPHYKAMSDAELRAETEVFRRHLRESTEHEATALQEARAQLEKAGAAARPAAREAVAKAEAELYKAEQKVFEAILPEAFAVAREASRRATGMFPFEVQVQAGALMSRGIVAEMYTGEGKTLAAVLPAYLAALAGHGFHIATVNDYLAQRDAKEMGAIFGFLGLSVGVLQSGARQLVRAGTKDAELEPAQRKDAYLADITYGTAAEFGFDHLRDNGVKDLSERVQRPLYGVIADEVDAILIDEARVPLIIAEPGPAPELEKLERAKALVDELAWKTDVEWDQEEHFVGLTEQGADKLAAKLGIETLYDAEHMEQLAYINDALQAQFLLRKDEDYAVLDDRVVTIGKNGHALEGRRFTQGLHQALEAKEGVPVLPDTLTRASITMREYLGLYARRSGMTGTALSASDVFNRVYGLDVVREPQRKKLIRVDHPDRVFKSKAEKEAAFLDAVAKAHAEGRPILIGVEWTKTAETLVAALEARGLPARMLTAKNDDEEAEIIANAGRLGAITVVTPRGGRGVDIKLGGSERSRAAALMREEKLSKKDAIARARAEGLKERAQVMALGGLYVMGYEHLDSRRRDDQLRGRAGRQGDPGATVFFTSLEDPLYDGVKEAEKIKKGEAPYDEAAARVITERALDYSEGRINDELLHSVPFDEVIAVHRQIFYGMREDVLGVEDCREPVRRAIREAIETVFERMGAAMPVSGEGEPVGEVIARELYSFLSALLPLPEQAPPPDWAEKTLDDIHDGVDALVTALLDRRDRAVGEEINRVLERATYVEALDQAWVWHLDVMANIRQGIGLRSYGQRDPRVEYRTEGNNEMEELLADIRARVTSKLLKTMPFLAG